MDGTLQSIEAKADGALLGFLAAKQLSKQRADIEQQDRGSVLSAHGFGHRASIRTQQHISSCIHHRRVRRHLAAQGARLQCDRRVVANALHLSRVDLGREARCSVWQRNDPYGCSDTVAVLAECGQQHVLLVGDGHIGTLPGAAKRSRQLASLRDRHPYRSRHWPHQCRSGRAGGQGSDQRCAERTNSHRRPDRARQRVRADQLHRRNPRRARDRRGVAEGCIVRRRHRRQQRDRCRPRTACQEGARPTAGRQRASRARRARRQRRRTADTRVGARRHRRVAHRRAGRRRRRDPDPRKPGDRRVVADRRSRSRCERRPATRR